MAMDIGGQTLTSIYDAAMNPDRWDAALDAVRRIGGASGATLHSIDRDPGAPYTVNVLVGAMRALTAEDAAYYLREFGHYDKAAWEIFCQQPALQVFPESVAYGDMAALRSRPDFVWLERHCGIFRRAAARLNDNPGWLDSIVVHLDREYDHIPASLATAINPYLPHLAKANELGRLYSRLTEHYRAVIAVLDKVLIGTAVVRASGQVMVANETLQRLVERCAELRITPEGYLRFREADVDARFRQMLASACRSATGQGDSADHLLTVERGTLQCPLLIDVSPLRDVFSELSHGLAGAIVFVIDADEEVPVDLHRVLSVYGLTGTECAVSALLLQGLSTQEIAEQRNVSEQTIKSQLTAVRAKTRTSNRLALVRALLKTSPPVG